MFNILCGHQSAEILYHNLQHAPHEPTREGTVINTDEVRGDGRVNIKSGSGKTSAMVAGSLTAVLTATARRPSLSDRP